MSAPNVPVDAPVVIDQAYMVPCVRILEQASHWGTKLWYPVRGPKHDDAALSFTAEHYHLDFRFITPALFEKMLRVADWGKVVLSPEEKIQGDVLQVSEMDGTPRRYESSVRRMVAHRQGVDFPDVPSVTGRLRPLYENATLKDGLVCPHKGAPLLPTADAEGFSVCPLHGLCWNLRERRLATPEEEAIARNRRRSSPLATQDTARLEQQR